MSQISIELNQQEFVGGDKLEGVVVVQLAQDTPIRGIRLRLQGYEESRWREGSGKRRHTHSERLDCFDEEITLQGRPRLGLGTLVADSFKAVFSKQDYEVLTAGVYRYPFSYVLPTGLPGDYESALTQSRIYYGAIAQVDLPLKFDLKAVASLVVHEPASPTEPQPVSQRLTKQFLFDSESLVEAAVHITRDTCRLGEPVHCDLEVMNRAPKKDIHTVTLALRQIERLRAGEHSCVRQAEIGRVRIDHCRFPYKDRSKVLLAYDIPADLYPTIAGSLIQLDYELDVTLEIPWAVDARLSVPIRLLGGTGAS